MVNGQKVTGQKVTGQIVTKLLGQKVTGQKVTIYIIFFTLEDKKSQDQKSQLICLLNMYVGRTESHNMYTMICIILLCIVLKTDRDIVSGSFCCFKLYYSLSYQLAV